MFRALGKMITDALALGIGFILRAILVESFAFLIIMVYDLLSTNLSWVNGQLVVVVGANAPQIPALPQMPWLMVFLLAILYSLWSQYNALQAVMASKIRLVRYPAGANIIAAMAMAASTAMVWAFGLISLPVLVYIGFIAIIGMEIFTAREASQISAERNLSGGAAGDLRSAGNDVNQL